MTVDQPIVFEDEANVVGDDPNVFEDERIVFEDDRIVFQNVSKFYGEVLGVNQVNLEIEPGITSLVGPNGSGKTTLMNLTMGLLQPDDGRITVDVPDGAVTEDRRNFVAGELNGGGGRLRLRSSDGSVKLSVSGSGT